MAIVPAESFPFCGPSYLSVSALIDSQRSINLYPEVAGKGSGAQMALIGRPGLTAFGTPDVTQSSVRGLWAGNGRLFAAIGVKFYEVSSIGGITANYGVMPGTSTAPVYAFANGTQLLVLNGLKVSLADPGGPTMTDVFNATALEYLDGFYFAIASGASLVGANPNQINASNFLDGSTWSALNYVIRTGSADLTNGLAAVNGLLVVFGQKSMEFWYNAGTSGFPLARVQGSTIGLGLVAPKSIAKFYNTVMWLGADDRGYAQVYMLQGMNPVRVSNPAIENYIVSTSTFRLGVQKFFAYGYQEEGHTFYVLNLTNGSGVPQSQVVYDLTTGLWHERTYDASVFPVSFASMSFAFGVTNYVGDYNSGAIYTQDIRTPSDGVAGDIVYIRQCAPVNNQGKVLRFNSLELLHGDNSPAGACNPVLTYSNTGGRSFSGSPSYSMLQAIDQGFGGTQFYRSWARQLGRSRDRVFKTTITEHTNLVRIAQAYLDVS